MRHSVWKVCLESIFNEYYSFYFPHIFIFFQRESTGMWHLIWKVFPVHIHFIIFLHEKVHLVWKVCSIHWFWGMCIKCSIQWIMMTWTFEGAKIYNILSLGIWRRLSRSNKPWSETEYIQCIPNMWIQCNDTCFDWRQLGRNLWYF